MARACRRPDDRLGGAVWPAPQEAPDIRAMLRQATAHAHERLHKQPHLAALLRGELSRAEYAALLLRLLGLHVPIEQQLARKRGHAGFAWYDPAPLPARSTRLRHELAALGLPAMEIAAAPMASAVLPALRGTELGLGAALGCAWVVEGSALGGRLLAPRAAAITSAAASACADGTMAFFQAGPAALARWRACCAAIEAFATTDRRRAALVAGAVATFDGFAAWLDAPA